jgi:Ca2+-transporting ATPase
MVLLDDDFSTIIKAVKEGRRVYDNILKFVKYIMATNTSEILTLLLGPMFGLPVALLPIHILWLNLTSDGLPAISLSFEKAENEIMNRPPRPPGQSVFSDGRGLHMIWIGILMAGIALSLQSWAIKNGSPWQTMIFDFLCLAQLGHVVAIRSEKEPWFKMGMFSNKLLIIAGLLTLLLQFVITFTPFLQPIFRTETLTFKEFILVGSAALLVYLVVEIKKYYQNNIPEAKIKREKQSPN